MLVLLQKLISVGVGSLTNGDDNALIMRCCRQLSKRSSFVWELASSLILGDPYI